MNNDEWTRNFWLQTKTHMIDDDDIVHITAVSNIWACAPFSETLSLSLFLSLPTGQRWSCAALEKTFHTL